MNYLDILLKCLFEIEERPFCVNAYFSRILSDFSNEKYGIYIRTLNNTLMICEKNTQEIPKELTPNRYLIDLSSKLCEGVYFFEKQPLNFFLLGERPDFPLALIMLDKKFEDKSMLQTMSLFYQALFSLRREKIKSLNYDVIFSGKENPVFLKGDRKEELIIQDLLKRGKNLHKIESIFLLPEEEVFGIRTESFFDKFDLLEKISFIKKHADSLQDEFDRGSPYFTELATISKMASRIIEFLES